MNIATYFASPCELVADQIFNEENYYLNVTWLYTVTHESYTDDFSYLQQFVDWLVHCIRSPRHGYGPWLGHCICSQSVGHRLYTYFLFQHKLPMEYIHNSKSLFSGQEEVCEVCLESHQQENQIEMGQFMSHQKKFTESNLYSDCPQILQDSH